MEKITFKQWFWISILCLLAVLAGIIPSAFGCSACGGTGSDMYVRVHAVVENDRLKRLAISWEFTETVARMLAHEYDLNKDGRLNHAEKQALETFFSSRLADNGYFTTVTINNRRLAVPMYENVRLTFDSSDHRFGFDIPLSQDINDGIDLTLQVLDPDARFSFFFRHNSVTWNEPQGYSLIHNAFVFPKKLEIRIQDAEIRKGQETVQTRDLNLNPFPQP